VSKLMQGIATAIVAAALALPATAQKRSMDVDRSRLTIRVEKGGTFSAFGHAHQISAPIERGEVNLTKPLAVWFDVKSSGMKVMDPEESEDHKAEVQRTMLGAEVLDVEHFPEIHFASDSVEVLSNNHWRVHGQLSLHGQTRPIMLETTLEKGHYQGTAIVQQTNFGITPIKVAGGTIKVKDEVRIEYDIVLAGQ